MTVNNIYDIRRCSDLSFSTIPDTVSELIPEVKRWTDFKAGRFTRLRLCLSKFRVGGSRYNPVVSVSFQ